jgi:hypothetical protein
MPNSTLDPKFYNPKTRLIELAHIIPTVCTYTPQNSQIIKNNNPPKIAIINSRIKSLCFGVIYEII